MAADDEKHNLLVDLTVKGFAEETSRESPAPGGGSVSAYMGALGASLATMVANLSSHKPGWDEQWQQFANVAEEGMALQERLLHLVDEDTEAFNRLHSECLRTLLKRRRPDRKLYKRLHCLLQRCRLTL